LGLVLLCLSIGSVDVGLLVLGFGIIGVWALVMLISGFGFRVLSFRFGVWRLGCRPRGQHPGSEPWNLNPTPQTPCSKP